MNRAAFAALGLAVALAAPAAAQQRTVNVYNWSDYVDPKVLEEFTQETGIKVVYDTYDNNEIVETKLWPASPVTTSSCRPGHSCNG